MFFSEELLTRKKGSFGVIWLAATLGARTKKITRKDLSAVDLPKSCELIAEPPEPMALRLSGCLLVGVARVYNQNYEIFYTDVNQCQIAIRRSFATEFSAGGTSGGASSGVDMIGDGKSRHDQITFADLDIGRQSGFDFESGFAFINWLDPLGKLKVRRSTSKLDSLPSQHTQGEDSTDEEETDEETDDGSQLPVRRKKGSKIDSSPMIGPTKIGTGKKGYLSERSPFGDGLDPNFDFPVDQPIDLDLFPDVGNDSISAPSGRGFELPDDGAAPIDIDQFDQDMPFLPDNDVPPATPAVGPDGQPIPSAMKRKHASDSDGSASDVEKELDKGKKTKKKQKKKLRFDTDCELADAHTTAQTYRANMDAQHLVTAARETEKKVTDRVDALVNRAGLVMEFFDPDLEDLFADLTKIETFKWERDVAAHRQGREMTIERRSIDGAPLNQDDPDMSNAHPFMDDQPNDVFVDHNADYPLPQDYDEFAAGVNPVGSRRGSEVPEAVRRGSQLSQQSNLPWQNMAFGRAPSEDGYPAGVDSSFTPQTLRLSVMTPQELTIRRRTRQTFSSGVDIGRNRIRSRSLTGSIIGRGDGEARMLIGDDDDELPPNDIELEITESQAEKRDDIPDAFRPHMLASLETLCRKFLAYIEQTLLTQGVDSLVLEDLAPTTASRRVGASAFYNCLTLATKRCLILEQEATFAPISIRLTA